MECRYINYGEWKTERVLGVEKELDMKIAFKDVSIASLPYDQQLP